MMLCLSLHTARAAVDFRVPTYKYGGKELHLMVFAPTDQRTIVKWVAVNDKGRPVGTTRRKKFKLEKGDNSLTLKAGDHSGHHLRFEIAGVKHRVWANRGTWFSMPKSIAVAESRSPGLAEQLSRPEDILLAKGFGASMGYPPASKPHLTLGRTLGYESSYGIAINKKHHAFVMIASGSVGPIKLTLGQRIGKKKLQYWDYYLVLDPKTRRYVIPLDRFTRRGRSSLRFESIHSVTVRSLHPARKDDKINISFIGLAPPGPVIADIRTNKYGSAVIVKGPLRYGARLTYRDSTDREVELPVRNRNMRVPKRAKEVWLCYQEDPVQMQEVENKEVSSPRICDPPDAPHSNFLVPPEDGQAYILDQFDTQAHVNAYHIPVIVFGSTTPVEHDMRFRRLKRSLSVTFFPQDEDDYGGYLTYFPSHIPEGLKTLELDLRGQIPPEAVRIGLRDESNREARVSLRSYLRGVKPKSCYQFNPEMDLSRDIATNRQLDCTPTIGAFLGLERDDILITGSRFRRVKIPIEAFGAVLASGYKNQPRLSKYKSVSVTMTNAGKRGVTHQIEIGLVQLTTEPVPVTITRFDGEINNLTALGGIFITESERGAEMEAQFDAAGHTGNGLKVRVSNERPEGYSLVALGMGRVDAREYTNLSFYVRGRYGGEDAAVYLNDGNNRAYVNLSDYTTVTTKWNQVWIPLTEFEGVNLKHLTQLVLAWEEREIDGETIYFDDFVIE
ncbi:MAG: hypothetical protein GY847_22160 [Proteobacteria bacterium]|nr:hypothetical protein [Pseudomonadota bacterium]